MYRFPPLSPHPVASSRPRWSCHCCSPPRRSTCSLMTSSSWHRGRCDGSVGKCEMPCDINYSYMMISSIQLWNCIYIVLKSHIFCPSDLSGLKSPSLPSPLPFPNRNASPPTIPRSSPPPAGYPCTMARWRGRYPSSPPWVSSAPRGKTSRPSCKRSSHNLGSCR